MSELLTIPLASIHVDKKANPRGTVDADRLQPLVDSIALYGVLQPILVTPAGESSKRGSLYVLVAGQRRFTAAGIAGLTEIPAVVRDTNGDTAAVALVENLQREQLTPIEEAHAFQAAIAAGTSRSVLAVAISKSEDLINARLDLLELPDVVQKRVDAGDVGLGAAAALRVLAPAGDVVVAHVANTLADPEDELNGHDVETNAAWVLSHAIDDLGAKAPFLYKITGNNHRHISWPDKKVAAEISAKANVLPDYEQTTHKRVRHDALTFTAADVDAARAYGCLLELDGTYYQGGWVNDPVWLADRINDKLDKAITAWQRKQKKTTGAAAKNAPADPVADAQAAARDERAKQRRAQLAARERNVTLGIALTKKLHAPKPTADNMRLVAELLLEYAGEDLARRGTRLVDETSQTVSTRKDGTISNVTHLKTTRELRDLLDGRLAKATTPEQILGVLLQAIVASHLADKKALPASDQYGEVRGLGGYGGSSRAKQLVAKVAAPLKPKPKTATPARRTASTK